MCNRDSIVPELLLGAHVDVFLALLLKFKPSTLTQALNLSLSLNKELKYIERQAPQCRNHRPGVLIYAVVVLRLKFKAKFHPYPYS